METKEEGTKEVSGLSLNNLRIEMAVSVVEAEEGLEAALRMGVEEVEGCEGNEEGGGTPRKWNPLSSSLRKLNQVARH